MFLYLLFFSICFALYLLISTLRKNKSLQDGLQGRHVLITGGSKGIGLELAKLAVKNGAHVTIVARNESDLNKARLELNDEIVDNQQKILIFSADVSKNSFEIDELIVKAETESGPVSLLACSAGNAVSRSFINTSVDDLHKMMNINYFGAVHVIKSCISSMKKSTGGAQILLFSSLGGIFGLYGYSGYSASKFALVGLAEVLSMELRPLNISITVSFPPDTDTPGFAVEQIGKPKITKLISEEGGMFSANQVAYKALVDCVNREFISTVGFNGFFLTTLCSGMMPTKSWIIRVFQILFMGIFRMIGLYFLKTCDKIVDNNMETSEINLVSGNDKYNVKKVR